MDPYKEYLMEKQCLKNAETRQTADHTTKNAGDGKFIWLEDLLVSIAICVVR